MKKMMAVLFAVLLLAVCAFAEEAETTVYTSGSWKYVLLEDGTAEIVGFKGNVEALIIPDALNGYVVTAVDRSAFWGCSFMTSVTIPDCVKTIDGNPFCYGSQFTDIIVSQEHPVLEVIVAYCLRRRK